MLSPVGKPRVQRQAQKFNEYDETTDKENATHNPISSPRVGLAERVLQPSKSLCSASKTVESLPVHVDVLPRKRRFSDVAQASSSGGDDTTDACERVTKRSCESGYERTGVRINPFDKPLEKVAQSAAPIRSYRPKAVIPVSTKPITDPPPRILVSYADLWEGVSCIDNDEGDEWDDDGYSATYDFLYDGVWKRCVGRFAVPVEKIVKDLSWSHGRSPYRSRRKRFRDLDRPVSFNDLWETC